MDSVINIHEAHREGARTVTAFAGVSGSGKTYTAIQYAYGLAGYDASKVGLIDTENKRGSLYADILRRSTRPTDKPFKIGDLRAPFSPERYMLAMRQFEEAGVEVLVVDSITHSWEGTGGCDDIANAPGRDGKPPKMPRWNAAKRENRRMVNYMLQCDMDVVLCVRAREKSRPGKDEHGKTIFVSEGILPVCEKNLMFEATLSLLLHDGGSRYDLTKVPEALRYLFPGAGYITADTGYAVREWIAGGSRLDPKVEKFRNRLLTVTEQGLEYVNSAWLKVPGDVRKSLGDSFLAELRAAAKAYDDAASARDESSTVSDINERASQDSDVPNADDIFA